MTYHVELLRADGSVKTLLFTWWQFETAYMDNVIETFVNQEYPDAKYTRDKAGVIHYANGVEVVHIEGVSHEEERALCS